MEGLELKVVAGRGMFIFVLLIILACFFVPTGFYYSQYKEFIDSYNDVTDKDDVADLKKYSDGIFGMTISISILVVLTVSFIYFFQKQVEKTLNISIFIILMLSIFILTIVNIIYIIGFISQINKVIDLTDTDNIKKSLLDTTITIVSTVSLSSFAFSFVLFVSLIYLMLRNNPFVETKTTRRRLVRKTLFK